MAVSYRENILCSLLFIESISEMLEIQQIHLRLVMIVFSLDTITFTSLIYVSGESGVCLMFFKTVFLNIRLHTRFYLYFLN